MSHWGYVIEGLMHEHDDVPARRARRIRQARSSRRRVHRALLTRRMFGWLHRTTKVSAKVAPIDQCWSG